VNSSPRVRVNGVLINARAPVSGLSAATGTRCRFRADFPKVSNFEQTSHGWAIYQL
jgi:hypothetical protein